MFFAYNFLSTPALSNHQDEVICPTISNEQLLDALFKGCSSRV